MRIQVDYSEVTKMLAGIEHGLIKKAIPKAIAQTANQTRSIMKGDAAYYSAVTDKSKGRWKWQTYGRIPRAITISKAFKRGKDFNAKEGDSGRKVFIQTARNKPDSQRAPHWNLVVYGHKQMIPTGKPGRGEVRQSKRKPYQPGNPMFNGTYSRVPAILRKNLIHQMKATLKASSQ